MSEPKQAVLLAVPLYEVDGKPSCESGMVPDNQWCRGVEYDEGFYSCFFLGPDDRDLEVDYSKSRRKFVRAHDLCPLRAPDAATLDDLRVVLNGRREVDMCDGCGRWFTHGHAAECPTLLAQQADDEARARLQALARKVV